MKRFITLLTIATLVGTFAGCASSNRRYEDHNFSCDKCRREAAAAAHGDHEQYHLVKASRCNDCGGDVEIYSEDGETYLKCSHCARNGVRCR
jgi:hypothetical protein